MTNFERIKAMSVEEMADILAIFLEGDSCINPKSICCDCKVRELCSLTKRADAVEWLESEVQDEAD